MALAFGGLLTLDDLSVGARLPHWFGWTPREFIEALGAWAIYALLPYAPSASIPLVIRFGVLPRRAAFAARLLVTGLAVIAIRLVTLALMGAELWRPWFIADVGLLAVAIWLSRTRQRTRWFPALVAVLSVLGTGLVMHVIAAVAFGGRGDPVVLARNLNSVVLLTVVLSAAGARLLDRGSASPVKQFVQYVLIFMVVPVIVFILGLGLLQDFNRPLPPSAEQGTAPPNLVIMTADALRADYCSVYGGDADTPSLERLAQGGVRFDRYYTLAPWTLPSLYGLFASKYPPGFTPAAPGEAIAQWKKEASSYALIEEYWIGTSQSLLGELSDRGYNTAAIVGNPLFKPDDWLVRDADEVRLAKFTATRLRGPFRATPALQSLLSRWWPDAFVRRPVDMTRAATEYAEAFLRYTREQPFALWVHYFDPHAPYDPPAEYREADGPWPRFPPADYHTRNFLEQWRWIAAMPEQHRAYVRSLYEGEIAYMDAGVGRILDALDRNGLVDNTYVVFSSDHGEEFWEHEKWEHGHSLFEDQIHVPLIVRGPGISRAAVETPVSAVDVLPTVREWLDLPRLTSARGSSMADALASRSPIASTPVFAQSTSFYTEPLQTVIDGHVKAIHGTDSGEWRLFDLERDPAEQNDLSTEAPDELARLQERMETWRQSFPVTFDQLQTGADDSRLEEFEEMLNSMGYVN